MEDGEFVGVWVLVGVSVYTSELDYDTFKREDCEILLKERLKIGRERLDNALESIQILCEPVAPHKSELDYQHYFCGNPEIEEDLKNTEVKRNALFKATIALIRAFANISAELEEAEYSIQEQNEITKKVNFYIKLREEIRKASGEVLDLKTYEADMRHLIDNYIQADDSQQISPFGDIALIDLIVKSGISDAVNSLPNGIKGSRQAVQETIENNIRQKIIKEHLIDPAYYENMSTLLNEIIKERKTNALNYEEYLKKIADLANKVQTGTSEDIPVTIKTPAQRSLFNNLNKNENLAIEIHDAINLVRPDGWRGNEPKERVIKQKLFQILNDESEVERIFEIIKLQQEY